MFLFYLHIFLPKKVHLIYFIKVYVALLGSSVFHNDKSHFSKEGIVQNKLQKFLKPVFLYHMFFFGHIPCLLFPNSQEKFIF